MTHPHCLGHALWHGYVSTVGMFASMVLKWTGYVVTNYHPSLRSMAAEVTVLNVAVADGITNEHIPKLATSKHQWCLKSWKLTLQEIQANANSSWGFCSGELMKDTNNRTYNYIPRLYKLVSSWSALVIVEPTVALLTLALWRNVLSTDSLIYYLIAEEETCWGETAKNLTSRHKEC